MSECLPKKETIESGNDCPRKMQAVKGIKICVVILATMFMFLSTANAKTETFEGTGAYPITDDKTHDEVKELAKKEAIRDALEKVGVTVYNQTQVENQTVTKDVVKITARSILKILSDKYNFVPLYDNTKVGMYKATIVISIDTDELDLGLQNFLKKEFNKQSGLAKRYEDLRKLNDANTKRIADLEKQFAEKNPLQNIQQIKSEIAEIDRYTLYAQKIDEGWQAWENDDFKAMLKLFDSAVKLNLNDYQGYLGRGLAYHHLKNYSEAISDYEQAIELNPDSAETYYNQGLAYIALEDYPDAIIDFNKVIRLKPDFAWAYYGRGFAHYNLKNHEQAISDCTQAIKLNLNLAEVYFLRGIMYADLKNYEQAISDYDQAIRLNPNLAVAYTLRGIMYADLKNYEQAISDYDQAIELNPKLAVVYALYALRGKCYQALGNNSQAEKDFAKAKELGYSE